MPNYAKIAEPLEFFKRKSVRFVWGPKQQSAFDQLKQLLVSSHVMAAPDLSKPYKLYTDACNLSIGAILV